MDLDSYGNSAVSQVFEDGICPLYWTEDNTDCDDTDILTHPGAPELPGDGISQDCVGGDLVLSDLTGVFVAASGDDANPGTMAAPVQTINAGAALALQEGKSVFVAAGDYMEKVGTGVSLFGAYESVGWTRNIEGYTTSINSSTDVAVSIGSTATIVVQGFTINGGPGSVFSYGVKNSGTATLLNNTIDGGSGAYNIGVFNDGTATLLNNTIDGGPGGYSSGVVNMYDGTATLLNNTIDGGSGSHESYGVSNIGTATLMNNDITGGSGGDYSYGMHNDWGGTATLVNNTIDGGSGDMSVGVSNYGTATLTNNTIDGGLGDGQSFGVWNKSDCTATLSNNTINGGSGNFYSSTGVRNEGTATLAHNVIDSGSGAISYGVTTSGTATLMNNTIDGSGSEVSTGVYIGAGIVTLLNNDIWGQFQSYLLQSGGANITQLADLNACTWTGCVEASGNISDDPLFVDPDAGDFHLQSGSPCINTGIDPTSYIAPALAEFDFEDDARPYGAGWDIGADEWTP